MAKKLMKGAEVLCEAAINSGCIHFFGYPITPQNEVPEYMSKHLPSKGGVFVQAESEVAAINMVYGCASTGKRVMTSSSSPGIALKQEGISFLAGAELPSVIVSVSRGGPGLGGILPSQADYFQATRGGGNGDYNCIVLAPSSLQELNDLTQRAFYLADKYRNPVMVLADGMLIQMMEPVELNVIDFPKYDHSTWAATGKGNREQQIVTSIYLDADELENHNLKLQAKYNEMRKTENLFESYQTEDAELVVVSYGGAARIVKNAINELRAKGVKVGMIRPISLFPFPEQPFDELSSNVKKILSAEFSMGQMIDDVKIATKGKCEVSFYGRTGGNMFSVAEISEHILTLMEDK